MKKYTCRINTGLIIRLLVVLSLFVILILISESSFSYVVRSGFERKMSHLQSKFTGVILPIMSVFGLAYAGILAAIGNEAAKSKITFCIIGSIVGFLSPYIIGWIQGILG